MDYFSTAILAILQGLTEFLPISSSAHLIILPHWLGWEEQGLLVDVATHLGSLLAVLWYFRTEISNLGQKTAVALVQWKSNPESDYVLYIVVATLPVVIVGFVFMDLIEDQLRTIPVIGLTTIVFGLILWIADRTGRQTKTESDLSLRYAITIGLAQVLALIPGTSRAGVTITCALLIGFSRTAASRFSFLLSIPTIVGASVLTLSDALEKQLVIDWIELFIAIGVSFVVAYWCIALFLKFIEKIGLLPFVVYRLVLGGILLSSLWLISV